MGHPASNPRPQAGQPLRTRVLHGREGGARATVLVVDDDGDIRSAVMESLEGLGYRVCEAVDGQDAADQLLGGLAPDAIFLDLMMPRMDGWTLLARLRSDPDFDAIRVVVASAALAELPAGADEGLEKPFDLEQLRRAMARLTTH